jgi:hypothetical protein
MSEGVFVEMVRRTLDYVFSVVPKGKWEVTGDSPKMFIIENGTFSIALSRIRGCSIIVCDHSRDGNNFILLKLNIFHHDSESNQEKERNKEAVMFVIARGELKSMMDISERSIK